MAADPEVEQLWKQVEEGMKLANPEGSDDPLRIMQDQEQIQEYIRKLQEQMGKAGQVAAPGLLGGIPPSLFIIAFVLFFCIIGWFSYKLIKSLSDKEKKREEKRKLKEMKKKK